MLFLIDFVEVSTAHVQKLFGMPRKTEDGCISQVKSVVGPQSTKLHPLSFMSSRPSQGLKTGQTVLLPESP